MPLVDATRYAPAIGRRRGERGSGEQAQASGRYVILAVVLSACGCQTAPARQPGPNAPAATIAQRIGFSCSDGSAVEVSYPSADTAELVREGRSIDMTLAVSASGARYVGGGWEWWTKGAAEGTLSPLAPGEGIASSPGVVCAASGSQR